MAYERVTRAKSATLSALVDHQEAIEDALSIAWKSLYRSLLNCQYA